MRVKIPALSVLVLLFICLIGCKSQNFKPDDFLAMVVIERGSFLMGSPDTDPLNYDDETQHCKHNEKLFDSTDRSHPKSVVEI